MKRLGNNKLITGLIVTVTLVLASIAVFTAFKLYQLGDVAIAPNVPQSQPYAFSCSEYDMLVDTTGTVRISNNTTSPQPARDIDFIVNGEVLGSFSVPALDAESDAILGGINLPLGDFNWSIVGDILCQGNTSNTTHTTNLCQQFRFTVSADEIPTLTPTPTALLTSTPIPTATPTPTQEATSTNTPTPTSAQIVQTTPTATSIQTQLPVSGTSYPTFALILLASFFLGFVLLAAI